MVSIQSARSIALAVFLVVGLLCLGGQVEAGSQADNNIVSIKTGVFHYDVDSRLPRFFDRLSTDQWEIAQEIEYERRIIKQLSVAAVLSYNGDLPAANLFAMTFPFGLLIRRADSFPFGQLWEPNYTHGAYWLELRHYAAQVFLIGYPVSIPLGYSTDGLFEIGLGAGGGAYWLKKKIRLRKGPGGSLAGKDAWELRPGASGLVRMRISEDIFGISLEYRFQWVPPLREVMPLGYDYNVSGSLFLISYNVLF